MSLVSLGFRPFRRFLVPRCTSTWLVCLAAGDDGMSEFKADLPSSRGKVLYEQEQISDMEASACTRPVSHVPTIPCPPITFTLTYLLQAR